MRRVLELHEELPFAAGVLPVVQQLTDGDRSEGLTSQTRCSSRLEQLLLLLLDDEAAVVRVHERPRVALLVLVDRPRGGLEHSRQFARQGLRDRRVHTGRRVCVDGAFGLPLLAF